MTKKFSALFDFLTGLVLLDPAPLFQIVIQQTKQALARRFTGALPTRMFCPVMTAPGPIEEATLIHRDGVTYDLHSDKPVTGVMVGRDEEGRIFDM